MQKALTIKKKIEEIQPTLISKKEKTKKILPSTKKLFTLKNIEKPRVNGKQMKNKCIIIQK